MFGMATQQDLEVMDKFFSEFIQFVTSLANKANQQAASLEETAINEAITVIDQIVFQTNIPSLDAAVEA